MGSGGWMRHTLAMLPLAACAAEPPRTCGTACMRIHAPDECAGPLTAPLEEWRENYDACLSECEAALGTPGELGTYAPFEPAEPGTVQLENEVQAAAWIGCVHETVCQRFGEGYCEPISYSAALEDEQ